MEKNCIFCDIIKKKEGIVFEDGDVIIFKDIKPKAKEHFLVVPKKHIGSVKEATEEDELLLGKIIIAAKNFAESKSLEGYKLIFNVGREGGQIIDHLHLHLLSGFDKYNPTTIV